ncbi:hypothetical protein L2E82_48451 [Cichorium intybus]|uniref:Uncharacterized protein n=1 Tax=Cichorium intybus TaxID=13427 RepID=A0ACB8YYA3_CICIN|nr:hypothetical protein L2E82_48451 [Cichorium intybus]
MAITRSMDRARRMAVKHYRLIQAHDQLIDLHNPTPVSLSIPFVCGNCLKRTITVEVNLNEERRFEKTKEVVDGFTWEISADNDGSWSLFDEEDEEEDDEDEADDEAENEDEEDDDSTHNYNLDEEMDADDEDEEDDEDENEDEEDDEDENEDEEDDDYQHNYDLDEEHDTELDPNFDDEAEFVPDEEYYQGEDEDDGEAGGYFPSCTGLCINVVEF